MQFLSIVVIFELVQAHIDFEYPILNGACVTPNISFSVRCSTVRISKALDDLDVDLYTYPK